MGKFSVTFHPIFLLLSFILIYFGWFEQFLIYFIVLCLHEFAHYIVAKRLGYALNKVVFMPYGVGLGGVNQAINPKHEILIAVAGPLFNLILAVICVAGWWLVPVSYAYTELFVFSNLTLCFFNLLPVFPLDGGRVLIGLFLNKINRVKAYKIMKVFGFVFSGLFAFLFFLSVFYKINLTFFFVSVFLFSSCFGNDVNIYFERAHIQNFNKLLTSPMQAKVIVINKNTPLYKILKHINSSNYTLFCVLDNSKIIKVITESEMLKIIENNKY